MDRRTKIIEKVMKRVKYANSPEGINGYCYIWTGPHSGNGRGGDYPRMCLDGQTVAVHRVVWTNYYGYIPGKKQIDHICRNRLCVNHHHLEMVTHKKNMKRRDKSNHPPKAEGVE